MRVIGFSGKARHGKDTCAAIVRELAAEANIPLGTWAFAHPLKAQVYGRAGGEHTLVEVLDTKPPAVRRKLQIEGTEQGRDRYGEDLWVLEAEAYMELFRRNIPVGGVVFTDVRFPNEVSFIRLGGRVLRNEYTNAFTDFLRNASMEQWLEEDPSDPDTFAQLLDAEQRAHIYAIQHCEALAASGTGMALYIQSDRPTLTGEAANHPSETSLDSLDKETEFDGVIINNVDTTLDDLREQLRPFVARLFAL